MQRIAPQSLQFNNNDKNNPKQSKNKLRFRLQMSVRPHPLQQSDDRYRNAWLVDYYDEVGKRHKFMVRGTEPQAREIEHSLRIKTRREPVAAHPSLNEASVLFVDYYAVDHLPGGVERLRRSMKIILRLLGRYQFRSLTGPVIEDYKRTRLTEGKKPVKPATINKELAALSSFCKWAEEMGYCERIRIRRFPNKLTRAPLMDVPSRKEVVKLLRAIPRKKRGIFSAMYYLGLRSQEARDLRSNAVSWHRGLVAVTGKGNKQRVVPIYKKVAPYLRNSLPFYCPKDLRNILKWACKRSGINRDINPHLFRHAFGCEMIAAGVGIRALQEMMGHSTSVVTEVYSQMVASTLIKEMGKR